MKPVGMRLPEPWSTAEVAKRSVSQETVLCPDIYKQEPLEFVELVLGAADAPALFQELPDSAPFPKAIGAAPLESVWPKLQEWQNRGNGAGLQLYSARSRKTEPDWVQVVFVDIDGDLPPVLPAEPSLIDRTARGWHLFWVIPRTTDCRKIADICASIAAAINGDVNAANIKQVARMPGTWNFKDPDNPVFCAIVHHGPRTPIDPDSLCAACGAIPRLFNPKPPPKPRTRHRRNPYIGRSDRPTLEQFFRLPKEIRKVPFPVKRKLFREEWARLKALRKDRRKEAFITSMKIASRLVYDEEPAAIEQTIMRILPEWPGCKPWTIRQAVTDGMTVGIHNAQTEPFIPPWKEIQRQQHELKKLRYRQRLNRKVLPNEVTVDDVVRLFPPKRKVFKSQHELRVNIALVLKKKGYKRKRIRRNGKQISIYCLIP